ncbi:MAG: hypothetical protein ACP5OG_05045 [Candidatus Nanoarchaeia archaeon]
MAKKNFKIFIALIILINYFFVFNAYALDCPRGIENDAYPGECGLYTDIDKDGMCDLSTETTFSQATNTTVLSKANVFNTRDYNFLFILTLTFGLYFLSLFASYKNIISKVNHRKIWNIILLISFLGTGISGIILAIEIEYGVDINLPINTLFLHVETGIVMSFVSVFHIIWHIPYFKSIIPRKSI